MAISSSDKGQSEVAHVPATEQASAVNIQEPGINPRQTVLDHNLRAQPNPGPTRLNPKPPTTNPPTEPDRPNPAPIGHRQDRKTITVVSKGVEKEVEIQPTTTSRDVLDAAGVREGRLTRNPGAASAYGDVDAVFDSLKHGDKLYVSADPNVKQ